MDVDGSPALAGSQWSQHAYVKAPFDIEDFGHCLALDGDGSTLAVGTYTDSSNATGIGSDPGNNLAYYSGTVHLY